MRRYSVFSIYILGTCCLYCSLLVCYFRHKPCLNNGFYLRICGVHLLFDSLCVLTSLDQRDEVSCFRTMGVKCKFTFICIHTVVYMKVSILKNERSCYEFVFWCKNNEEGLRSLFCCSSGLICYVANLLSSLHRAHWLLPLPHKPRPLSESCCF